MDSITDGRGAGRAGSRRLPAGRRLSIAMAAVLVLGTAVLVADRGNREPEAPMARGPTAQVPDVYGRHVRGSLAEDWRFLAAVRRLPWDPPPPGPGEIPVPGEPPVDARRVVWAGDVPGGRWALVTASEIWWEAPLPPGAERVLTGGLVAAWFTGPPGASAEALRLHSAPRLVDPATPSALHDPRSGALLVVAAPGDVVEVSERREITADGQVTRSFEPVATHDGVASARVRVRDLPYSYAVQYRVRRDGAVGEPMDAAGVVTAELRPGETLRMAFPRGRPDAAGRATAERAGLVALAHLGRSRADTALTGEWAGPIPGMATGRAAVVTLTEPSGAVLVQGLWSFTTPEGRRVDGPCLGGVLPAGAQVRILPVACTVLDPEVPRGNFLVVVAPRPVTRVRAYAGDDTFLLEQEARDGVAVTPWPQDVGSVEAVTDQGVSLGRAPLIRSERVDVVLD